MYVADADDIAAVQFLVFDLLAVDIAAALTLVVLQKQFAIVLHNAGVSVVHSAGFQRDSVVFAPAQRANVASDGELGATVVFEAKLVHRVSAASVLLMGCCATANCIAGRL